MEENSGLKLEKTIKANSTYMTPTRDVHAWHPRVTCTRDIFCAFVPVVLCQSLTSIQPNISTWLSSYALVSMVWISLNFKYLQRLTHEQTHASTLDLIKSIMIIRWIINKMSWRLLPVRGWLHVEIPARTEISVRLLTYEKEKNNVNKKHEVCIKIWAFLIFKLYSSFQYVNSSSYYSVISTVLGVFY
jgi:hypothetical protein